MIRNGDLMCAIACSALAHVTSALSGHLVTVPAGWQARLPSALIRSLPERSRGILMQPSPSP
jgi:hypothetical protein